MLTSERAAPVPIVLLLVSFMAACGKDTVAPGGDVSVTPILAGGAGDQTATDVSGDGSAIYVSGPGVLAKFDPNAAAASWTQTQANVRYDGVAAGPGRAFVAGRAPAGRSTGPGPCGATDDVGGIEEKIQAGVYDAFGAFLGCQSQVLYPYSGFEFYYAAAFSGNKFFAAGHAQQSGVADGFPFVLARYDANGVFELGVTEPDLTFGTATGCCTGESLVLGLSEASGDLLAAGESRLPGSGEDDVVRPMVMRYTTDLVRIWKGRSPDRVGRFSHAAEIGGSVYAVGVTTGTGLFLIEKYDGTGSRVWSVESTTQGSLNGVVGLGGRVFGIGTTSAAPFGGSDGMVVEFDPSDGSILSTIYVGGAENDGAVGAVAIAGELWVAGTSRSHASGGNAMGEADLALWRVTPN